MANLCETFCNILPFFNFPELALKQNHWITVKDLALLVAKPWSVNLEPGNNFQTNIKKKEKTTVKTILVFWSLHIKEAKIYFFLWQLKKIKQNQSICTAELLLKDWSITLKVFLNFIIIKIVYFSLVSSSLTCQLNFVSKKYCHSSFYSFFGVSYLYNAILFLLINTECQKIIFHVIAKK